ncbi:hypothetical protein FB45DRAFT_259658 [Roridomyces roridus]|uniref:Secreted protein n=1 Tax=Roridomyces roridus TaxID=1738132 RepID=A0AAD7B908_9AGAR|nr:hypothetical protein FB45DRAFT_259658 [Roridomyces roridus]
MGYCLKSVKIVIHLTALLTRGAALCRPQVFVSLSSPPSRMALISNCSGVTLSGGTYTNVHGNLVNIFNEGRGTRGGRLSAISSTGR